MTKEKLHQDEHWICSFSVVVRCNLLLSRRDITSRIMDRLLKRIRRVRLKLYRWFLHDDNAAAHSSIIVTEFSAETCVTVINHPSYSPDLASADFFLFPRIKLPIWDLLWRGKRDKGGSDQAIEYERNSPRLSKHSMNVVLNV